MLSYAYMVQKKTNGWGYDNDNIWKWYLKQDSMVLKYNTKWLHKPTRMPSLDNYMHNNFLTRHACKKYAYDSLKLSDKISKYILRLL